MKNIAKYLFAISAAALAFAACEKETEVKPGEPDVEGCYGVFFPSQDAIGDHVLSPVDEPKLEFTVSRTNTSGEIIVPVTAEFSEEGIFEMSEVKFADGQAETTFTLSFPAAVEGTKYTGSMIIDDPQYASKYGSGSIAFDFSVMRVEMKYFLNPVTGEKAKVHFDQSWWGESVDAYIKYYEVNGIRTCFTECIPDSHYYNGYYEGEGFWGVGNEWTFYWYVKSGYIRIPLQNTGYHQSSYDADVYVFDYYTWDTDGDDHAAFLEYAASHDNVSYYDGNGGFYLSVRSYYMFGVGGWNPGAYDTVGIAEGFTRVDYSLDLDTDFSADGVTPVFVEVGPDVFYVNYVVAEGVLSAIQIENKAAAIINHEEIPVRLDEFEEDEEGRFATLELAPETTGKYTVVAVAYGNASEYDPQTVASVVINHVAAGDVDDLAVDVDVFTEDTPARYKELTEFDSFAYGVSGSDLTEVHIAVFAESTVTKNGFDVVAEAVKTGAKYAVSASVLAEINADGGFYNVVSGLDEDSTYYVFVWATNGYLDATIFETYTTAQRPEVWTPLGTGSYTDDCVTALFNVEPQTMAVEIERSESDPTRYRMVYPYDVKYPYNEPGDWDTSKSYDIIFYIPDANHVYILPQPIGVDWGYGMAYIASVGGYFIAAGYTIEQLDGYSIPFGVLEDGVITFPGGKGTMLFALAGYNDGEFYDGNENEAAKIVLPSEAAAAPKASAKASKPAGSLKNGTVSVEKIRYERDPQSIQVKTNVSYTRKAKSEKAVFSTPTVK